MANDKLGREQCPEDSIYINGPDGDDALSGTQVLQLYNAFFQKNDVWVVWSYFSCVSNTMGFYRDRHYPKKMMEEHTIRDNKYFTSQLRAFYNKLFLKVETKDMKD